MSARLVVVQGALRGAEFPLEGRMLWDVGSGDGLDVSFPDPEAARIHCKIYREGAAYTIFDLSGRGFLVNGQRSLKATLGDGDIFMIGTHSFRFVAPELAGARASDAVGGAPPPAEPDQPCVQLQSLAGNDAGKVYDLTTKDMFVLGRGGATDITVWDIKASRVHCRLDNAGGTYTLTDLDSSNGTLVNGKRVTSPLQLRSGDQIRIGSSVLRFHQVG